MSLCVNLAIVTCCADSSTVDRAKFCVRHAVECLGKRSSSMRIAGRYHREGTRKLHSDYKVSKQQLGFGASGAVKLATGRGPRERSRFAVKTLDLRRCASQCLLDAMVSEVEAHLVSDHPHIVQLVDVYEGRTELHLVFECMEGGDLLTRLNRCPPCTEQEAAQLVRQLLLSVGYIHAQGIVHRDIKPENILFCSADSAQIKLTDFGCCAHLHKCSAPLELVCGTLCYTAPEVFNKNYGQECDLWSIGVIAFMMIFGCMPFDFDGCNRQTVLDIQAGDFSKKLSTDRLAMLSADSVDFVRGLLTVVPGARLTTRAALEHSWIVDRTRSSLPEAMQGSVTRQLSRFRKTSNLWRACCSMAAWALPPGAPDSREKLVSFFTHMDRSRRGMLCFDDFKHGLLGEHTADDAVLVEMFDALDVDGDGLLHYSDFVMAMECCPARPEKGLSEEIFRRFDIQGAGWIGRDKVADIVRRTSMDSQEVQLQLQQAGLGQSGHISFKELEAYFAGHGGEADQEAGTSEDCKSAVPLRQLPDFQKMSHRDKSLDSCLKHIVSQICDWMLYT